MGLHDMSQEQVVRRLRLAAVALALSVPATAGADTVMLAQNTAPAARPGTDTPTTAPRPRRTPSPAPQQAQAQQPQAQPQQPQAPTPPQPQRTEIVRFDNWTVTCLEYADGAAKKSCNAQLQLHQTNNNQVVLAWTVSINESKQFVTVLQTPTGVAIGPGIELQPEKAGKRKLTYDSCEPNRCTSTLAMDATLLREVTAAPNAQVVIYALNGQSVQFNIPIKGFDKATAHLRANL
jgi:invasion protein IalB